MLLFLLALLLAGVRFDRSEASLRERWATPPSRFLEVRGQHTHLRDEGPREDPRPIVLLHGTSDSLHTWDGWVRALRGTRRVVRFDMLGFGLTGPAADHDYRIAAYVRHVRAVLDELRIEHCVLVGNSLGGQVAWRTALEDRARVERLVLVDAGGYPFDPVSVPLGFRVARAPGARQLARFLTPRFVVASSVRNVFGDPGRVTPELVDRFYELTLREGNRGALLERFAQAVSGERSEEIPTLRVPTLILWGAYDRLLPLAQGERFHREIPGSELRTFQGLGHVPHLEDPELTVAELQRWLAAHP